MWKEGQQKGVQHQPDLWLALGRPAPLSAYIQGAILGGLLLELKGKGIMFFPVPGS